MIDPLDTTPLIVREQAARDSAAWIGDAGWLRENAGECDPLGALKGIAIGLAIVVPLWVAVVFWVLS